MKLINSEKLKEIIIQRELIHPTKQILEKIQIMIKLKMIILYYNNNLMK